MYIHVFDCSFSLDTLMLHFDTKVSISSGLIGNYKENPYLFHAIQKLNSPFQSVVLKQTLEMPSKILSCKKGVLAKKPTSFIISFQTMKTEIKF